MLLTITNVLSPATDLGYLLHKNPERVHTFEMSFGHAYVFYPPAELDRCTAALLLDVDPVGLVRNRRGPAGDDHRLDQYVNDRPYVASSFLSVALGRVFGTALAGRSKHRPGLTETPLPLSAKLSVLPCRGGEAFLRRLFEPLGYQVAAKQHVLDEKFPDWGESPYFTVEITGRVRLQELLNHLYVLVPVLDDDKHYWVGKDEVEKLLRRGAGWLAVHPERERITERYLKHRGNLTRAALARLVDEELDPEEKAQTQTTEEEEVEEFVSLGQQRIGAVVAVLRASGARRVLDLGCGEGRLVQALFKEKSFDEIVGLDVSYRSLARAKDRLRLERLAPAQRKRVRLEHGSLTYRDPRLAGFEAAAVIEVIEHLDPPRLAAFERVVFEFARPSTVVITTPNIEYNVKFETLPAGKLRHRDHRFEWTRAQFWDWAKTAADRFCYTVRFLPAGPEDPTVGSPTQMAVFSRTN